MSNYLQQKDYSVVYQKKKRGPLYTDNLWQGNTAADVKAAFEKAFPKYIVKGVYYIKG